MAWTNPDSHIWTAGEVLTAANMNTYVRLNLDFLYGDAAWIAPVLVNGWVNYGSGNPNAGYRAVGSRIVLRGLVKSGTIAHNAFFLPAGYRPAAYLNYASVSNNLFCYVSVDTMGGVTPQTGSNVYVSFDGIDFDTFA
jgi:hypothetical protein